MSLNLKFEQKRENRPQCGNFRTLPSLRFYVKSILTSFETFDVFIVKLPQILKFKTSKTVKIAIFDPLKSAKIDFT